MDGKKPRAVTFEKWRPSVTSSLTATDGEIRQRMEYTPSYSWDSDGDWRTKCYKNRKIVCAEVL